MRPSIGARIAVYASCRRATSTIASFALPAARALSMVASAARAAAWALSMAARSARTVASSAEKLVRTWSYCSRAISPRSMSVAVPLLLIARVVHLRDVALEVRARLRHLRLALPEGRLRLADLGEVLGHRGLGLPHRRLERSGIDREQQLASLDVLPSEKWTCWIWPRSAP